MVKEIATASSEQAVSIGQINRAVSEMDKVVQKSATGAEESAAAAQEINAQMEMMKGFVLKLVDLVGRPEAAADICKPWDRGGTALE